MVIQVVGSAPSNGVGGVEAEEVRDGVKVGPEVLCGQFPAALHGDEVGNDSTSTHLSLPLSDLSVLAKIDSVLDWSDMKRQ